MNTEAALMLSHSLPPVVQVALHNRTIEPPYAVPPDIAERIGLLMRRRNWCPEHEMGAIDDSLIRLVADGREDASLLPIDLGFDPRTHDMSVVLSPAWTHVAYQDEQGAEQTAEGAYDDIIQRLAGAGFKSLVVDFTATGREIRYTGKRGVYEVQPHNDNCWLAVDSIQDAHRAYDYPERFR